MSVTLKDIQEMAIGKVRKIPVIRPGYTVRVHQKIKEGEKERIQIFEGLVIAVNSGHGADKSFTVRKLVSGVGVEKIFPLYSPKIEKIEVKKKSKVRQSKLYYMRERFGKSARLKESFVSEKELEEAVDELAKIKAEEQRQSEDGSPKDEAKQDEQGTESETIAPTAEPEEKKPAPESEEPSTEPQKEEDKKNEDPGEK